MELPTNMELQLVEINKKLKKWHAIKYGKWYYANKDCFEQYLNLAQGKFSVEEYADEFERLHYLCELGETLDFNHFLNHSIGLKENI